MKYARLFTAALFTTLAVSPYAQPQERLASPLLPKIYATFRAADLDRDGDLTQEERDAVGLPKSDSKAFDLDADGLWCEGEFVLYYRRLLKRNGKKLDRALELEAGRINRAYMDATNRGLNRDAAKRAADAVRAGTLEAVKEREADAQEVFTVPEFGPEPPADLVNEFSGEEVSLEPFAENEAVQSSEESLFEESTAPVTVPPSFDAPFEVPTWGPAPEESGESQENPDLGAEVDSVQEALEIDGNLEVPETPMIQDEAFEPVPVAENTAPPEDSLPVEDNVEGFTVEDETPFVIPEFTRPDAIVEPAPEVNSEESPSEDSEGLSEEPSEQAPGFEQNAPEFDAASGWPSLEELRDNVEPMPRDEAPAPLPSDSTPQEEIPSPVQSLENIQGSENSTGYDVFGEPTIEEAPAAEPLSETDAPTSSIDSPPADAGLETAPEKETAAENETVESESTEALDRPLTDAELDRLRQEQDAAAVRNRYGFEEPEEATSEEPSAEQVEQPAASSEKPAEPAQKSQETPEPEVTSPAEPKSEATESDTPKAESAQETAKPAAEPKKKAADKPLSLWERAERARKKRLREQQEKDSPEDSLPKSSESSSAGSSAGSR